MNPLRQSAAQLPGVGPRRSALLARLGLLTVGDFLTHFPRAYEDRTRTATVLSAADGDRVCIRATVAETPVASAVRKGLTVTRLRAFDETGMLYLTFFNSPYVKSALEQGREYIFFGAVEARGGRKSMVNPVFEAPHAHRAAGRILPIYPATQGVGQRLIQDCVGHALAAQAGRWEDPLPPGLIARHDLCDLGFAYEKIHFPDSFDDIERARSHLIFEELFIYGCASRTLKGQDTAVPGLPLKPRDRAPLLAGLGFAPTAAQTRAMDEIAADMTSGRRMNRLLQGDVGSGKTLVAAAAAHLALQNGAQAAIMAPTELLAAQHDATFRRLFEPLGYRCALLSGALTAAQKRAVKQAVAQGQVDLVCGTHALLEGDLQFSRPGLIVVDEQHRFGVRQRAALRQKAPHAHLLVMSATPIPRTLTLILYGDLGVSVLDEMPPGRKPVQTFADGEARRGRIIAFLGRQVAQGGQAYIVCPLIEGEAENTGERAAAAHYADRLRQSMPQLRIGLIHGRLRQREREAVMAEFAAGRLDVLVSTTVIEVGVDVPNATLMIVENADLFGLSQLHQLRGRVGRGDRQSYCILMSRAPGEAARRRLETLCATQDGFKIAEEDLRLRGPGDFFGDQQHGMPEFKIAGQAGDTRLIEQAISAAGEFCRQHPDLAGYPLLAGRVAELLRQTGVDRMN